MKQHRIGIIMNGVTGRMGTNQHLVRSILAIREQGGVRVSDDECIWPEPVLLGRNPNKLTRLGDAYGLPWETDMAKLLADDQYSVYFDAQTTDRRFACVRQAIEAGKHVYCEKPIAQSSEEAMELYRMAKKAGVKSGVVQDKLWLPGLRKLQFLIDDGFFGEILSVRCDFGYWVFSGYTQPSNRPSWNSRTEDGGGIFLDMLSHWRYVVDNLFGGITSLTCLGATHIKKRLDEQDKEYACTAEDAAYVTFITNQGIVCDFRSAWCTRVRRDDLLQLQVDGTKGSAVAGLRDCYIQPEAMTPKPIWNPDIPSAINYYDNWAKMPDNQTYDNAFKAQWELFLRHLALDTPFKWDLKEGAKGVQLAELGFLSWKERRWVDVPDLED